MKDQTAKNDVREQSDLDHQELREQLGEIQCMLAGRLSSAGEVSDAFASLSAHVAEHFIDEESCGLFDHITELAPRLSDRVDTLRNEHSEFRSTMRDLNDLASRGEGSVEWLGQIEEKFHEFSKQLMHHETKENDLLQEAYCDDIGSQD